MTVVKSNSEAGEILKVFFDVIFKSYLTLKGLLNECSQKVAVISF